MGPPPYQARRPIPYLYLKPTLITGQRTPSSGERQLCGHEIQAPPPVYSPVARTPRRLRRRNVDIEIIMDMVQLDLYQRERGLPMRLPPRQLATPKQCAAGLAVAGLLTIALIVVIVHFRLSELFACLARGVLLMHCRRRCRAGVRTSDQWCGGVRTLWRGDGHGGKVFCQSRRGCKSK